MRELSSDRYPIARQEFNRWVNSNIPVLLLVVDVKQNRLFFAMGAPQGADSSGDADRILIPLTEIDQAASEGLRRRLAA